MGAAAGGGQGPPGAGRDRVRLLLGALGVGSVAGAVALPKLRRAVPIDRRVVAGTGLFALSTVALAVLDSPALVFVAMVAAGMAWLAILTSFNVATQTAVPRWVRARALAVYLLVFQGGLAAGGALWGWPRGAWASGRPCWWRRPASAWGWWPRCAGASRGSAPST